MLQDFCSKLVNSPMRTSRSVFLTVQSTKLTLRLAKLFKDLEYNPKYHKSIDIDQDKLNTRKIKNVVHNIKSLEVYKAHMEKLVRRKQTNGYSITIGV